ncbi:MAG: aldo/keto reductase [Novosphingobium sp. 32-60-15]|uniref:aldo/keto reductase n=1 Tax=unclassified Novosphingobium TaxID=2644732 RepID=UPI000BC491C0|nr:MULTISPECIES: aldo/keto reductase [unclassified Novosphingobium]OYX61293.1 MAG: aldo/keto reductase [Novosphingobium sp. 32-60-15]
MPIQRRAINGHLTNPVGLGCMSLSWAYGGRPSEEDGIALLHRAIDIGYDHFDTARLYGLGHNETQVGIALEGRRDKVFLASKMGIFASGEKRGIDCHPDTIRSEVEISLKLLRTDHIDLYYLHRRDFTVPIEDSVGALADLVKEGKIGSIGLSEMSADTLRKAHAVHAIAAMQTEYSLWTRQAEIAVLDACRELGTTFVAFSPVARGALANGVSDPASLEEKDIRRAMPRFMGDNWPGNLALIQQFNAIALREGVTPAQLSLAWVLSRGDHIVTIPGTGKIAHLEENIARWDWDIPASVAVEVNALINQQTVAGHRYAGAMMPTIDTEDFA